MQLFLYFLYGYREIHNLFYASYATIRMIAHLSYISSISHSDTFALVYKILTKMHWCIIFLNALLDNINSHSYLQEIIVNLQLPHHTQLFLVKETLLNTYSNILWGKY